MTRAHIGWLPRGLAAALLVPPGQRAQEIGTD